MHISLTLRLYLTDLSLGILAASSLAFFPTGTDRVHSLKRIQTGPLPIRCLPGFFPQTWFVVTFLVFVVAIVKLY